MMRKTLRHMTIISGRDQVDDRGRQRLAVCLVLSVNRITEHRCEIFGPRFVVPLDPVLKFSQNMRDTKSMLHARNRKIRLPEIMNRDTRGVAHHIPAPGSAPKTGQERRTGHM